MREIRLYGSEGGGAVRSPYPYQVPTRYLDSRLRGNDARHKFEITFETAGLVHT